ncbi:GHKL domain-containing protein [Demequina capsici]|uniref:GHKL domain-containing protein n=1 Tax=Demequina capsici TaxID=3075620 RepID=A0AA96FEF4_9MICO|nr:MULTISPECIES: GHKL domain-containing protein [unclassified Demequina]WNM25171.1 GHKL domain-containing protein [Demequina sp. OYTSA14]WNM28075.1 GHKL domain-containing protein [Demequina sp. PMTSA13]
MTDAIADIPRWVTAFAEWSACLVYVAVMRKRVRGMPLAATIVAGFVLLWGIQEFAGTLPIGLWTFGMLLAVGAMLLFLWLTTDVKLREAGDLTARAFVLAEFSASFAWQLHYFFRGSNDTGEVGVVLLVFVVGCLFAIAYLIERRQFPRDIVLAVDNKALASALGIATATFLVSNLSFITTNTPFSGRVGPELLYIRTLVDLCGFVVLYAQRAQRLELYRAVELQSMNTLLHTQHEQYLASRAATEEVNRRHHDLKQYVQALRAETDEGARGELADQLEHEIRGLSGVPLDTGNTVVDTMLTSKTSQAASQGITITAVVDGSVVEFMDVIDIVTVFGNALDNAIEATRKVPEADKRLIRVAVYREGSFAMLRFENWFGGSIALVDGLPQTTKDEAHHHGYGLKNIRQAAYKYDGTMTVRLEDGWFVLRVLLPIPGA